MRIFSLVLIAFLSFVQISFAQTAELKQAVEKAFPQLHAPGLSAAVAVSNKIVWSQAFGLADVKAKKPAETETVYRYASISKSITAVAVMQLVEQGKVDLDAPVQKYVPTFPEKPEGKITIRHLMTHTSGIRHYRGLEMLSNRRYKTVAEALTIFENDALEFKPGEKYQYSSYAYNILAAVVEKASGQSFRDYLKEKIFKPAGMTAADLELLEEPNANRAVQYVSFRGDLLPAPKVDLSCKWAGGGIAGTAGDLVRFCGALESGKLLRPASCKQMYQRAILNDGSHTEYGLGWRVKRDAEGRIWVGHSGGATGGTTHFLHNLEHQVAVAILTNAEDVKGLDKLTLALGEIVLAAPAAIAK